MGRLKLGLRLAVAAALSLGLGLAAPSWVHAGPVPLVDAQTPKAWWFAFKLNARKFPTDLPKKCLFGGKKGPTPVGQSYIMATQNEPNLKDGPGLLGTSDGDPLGATFEKIYNGKFHYIVWNDQFKDKPSIRGGGTWAHAKGMVAWDDSGEGLVLQVSTPNWPRSASADHPRTGDGNTLGCISSNNVAFSQHFFALKLSHADMVKVLHALQTASVVTDSRLKPDGTPMHPDIFNNGGPGDVQLAAKNVGVVRSTSDTPTIVKLDSGVRLIAKPSALVAPPWHVVSTVLDGEPLRVANWWGVHDMQDTAAGAHINCWPLDKPPGTVTIVHHAKWHDADFSLELAAYTKPDGNHAKIGISDTDGKKLVVFGDENESGPWNSTTVEGCARSQFQRGGLFFVVDSPKLWHDLDAMFESGPKLP